MTSTKTPERASPDCCESCIGTGIGWNGPNSACSACNGRGVTRMPAPTSIEEPWAWNHYGPGPGDEGDDDGL